MAYVVMAYIVMAYVVMAYIVMAHIVMAYIVMAYVVMAHIAKGAEIFTGHSGIWHLHYVHLAHYHMPQNADCDPWGRVGVRQCKKPRQSNLFRLR